MMRPTACLLACLLALSGCTTVRLVQRDHCWVKQTHHWPGRLTEELGPCTRTPPEWSEDPLTRLVQECVAHSEHRWQALALEAWSRREPLPERAPDEAQLQICLAEATRVLTVAKDAQAARAEAEARALREQLEDARAGGEHLRRGHEQLTEVLREAAKHPPASAVATASALGDSRAGAPSTEVRQESAGRFVVPSERLPAAAPAPAPAKDAPQGTAPKSPGDGAASPRKANKADPAITPAAAPVTPASTPG